MKKMKKLFIALTVVTAALVVGLTFAIWVGNDTLSNTGSTGNAQLLSFTSPEVNFATDNGEYLLPIDQPESDAINGNVKCYQLPCTVEPGTTGYTVSITSFAFDDEELIGTLYFSKDTIDPTAIDVLDKDTYQAFLTSKNFTGISTTDDTLIYTNSDPTVAGSNSFIITIILESNKTDDMNIGFSFNLFLAPIVAP